MTPTRVEVIVTGRSGVGRTTFVGAISKVAPLITEA